MKQQTHKSSAALRQNQLMHAFCSCTHTAALEVISPTAGIPKRDMLSVQAGSPICLWTRSRETGRGNAFPLVGTWKREDAKEKGQKSGSSPRLCGQGARGAMGSMTLSYTANSHLCIMNTVALFEMHLPPFDGRFASSRHAVCLVQVTGGRGSIQAVCHLYVAELLRPSSDRPHVMHREPRSLVRTQQYTRVSHPWFQADWKGCRKIWRRESEGLCKIGLDPPIDSAFRVQHLASSGIKLCLEWTGQPSDRRRKGCIVIITKQTAGYQ